MNRNRLFAAAVAALALTACGTGASGDFEINIVEKTAQASYLCVGDDTYGDDIKLYTTASATVQWPVRLGQSDISCLQDSLLAHCFGQLEKGGIEEAMQQYVATPITMDEGQELQPVGRVPEDEYSRQLECEVTAKLKSVSSQYAVYEIYSYYYGGGAHPLYASSFVNFDVERSKVLTIADVIEPGKKPQLAEIIKECLRWKYNAGNDAQLAERSGIALDAIEPALEQPDFYLTDEGVTFYFAPYEIGPWAIGAIEVPVPGCMLE